MTTTTTTLCRRRRRQGGAGVIVVVLIVPVAVPLSPRCEVRAAISHRATAPASRETRNCGLLRVQELMTTTTLCRHNVVVVFGAVQGSSSSG
jgi:hypothetical protein